MLTRESLEEDPRYLTDQLITYIGSKRALLPFLAERIDTVRRRLGGRRLDLADLFAGTGSVSRFFKQHARSLHVNDLEPYSVITNRCHLANRSTLDRDSLQARLQWCQSEIDLRWAPGFLAELYAPASDDSITPSDRVFYTRRNAVYLDTACRVLQELDERERVLLQGPLLAAASRHANTSGVFKGFYKNREGIGQFGGSGRDALKRILGEIHLELPLLSRHECDISVTQGDANDQVRRLPALDLVYLDPPYNQHPYGSNYFMLNLLVDYRRPEQISQVSGIPADWRRSDYNRRTRVEGALRELIQGCPAKFVLLSYNSEGFLSLDRCVKLLEDLGKVEVSSTGYLTFRGSRNLRSRSSKVTEFLMLLEKRDF